MMFLTIIPLEELKYCLRNLFQRKLKNLAIRSGPIMLCILAIAEISVACGWNVAAPVQKALQIVLVRDITGAQFWGALSESLQPRLKAAKAGEAGDKVLAELGQVFQSRPLTNGMCITLNWIHPSTLQVTITPPLLHTALVVSSKLYVNMILIGTRHFLAHYE